MYFYKSKGFTAIELMIVAAIIEYWRHHIQANGLYHSGNRPTRRVITPAQELCCYNCFIISTIMRLCAEN
jgi:hypothetical protein